MIPLTKEAVLTKRIWDVDTWPYAPAGAMKHALRGKPSTSSEVLTEWWTNQLTLLPKSLEALNNKRLIAIPYLLAVGIGVSGSMFASALFGQALNPNPGLATSWGVVVVVFCAAYFYFFPATFDFV